MEELLGEMFSVVSMPRLYNKDQLPMQKRIELGSGEAYDCSSD
jgi:hypothetical protein